MKIDLNPGKKKDAEASANEREDRRIRRSRKLLKQGLLELMQGKKFSDISVRDITDRVDMNRGTFYLHYPNTTALLQSLEEDLEKELQELLDSNLQESALTSSLSPILEPILDYLTKNRQTFETLSANQDASRFFDRLQSLCYKNGDRLIRMRYSGLKDYQLTYLLSFVTFGIIGLIRTWFDRGTDLPKEELIRLADKILDGAAKECMLE